MSKRKKSKNLNNSKQNTTEKTLYTTKGLPSHYRENPLHNQRASFTLQRKPSTQPKGFLHTTEKTLYTTKGLPSYVLIGQDNSDVKRFRVNKTLQRKPSTQPKVFHHTTEKTLYTTKGLPSHYRENPLHNQRASITLQRKPSTQPKGFLHMYL
ncbi:unnamed protein product [Mytilus coruscus]|uniref:Uncharacterized protein n=1 Tax=Mytilus coruscus TaxID=42192 RepID=A0A6J8AQW7_MYTCO|nr:unnamed protein product [Mytilus coruscus]